MSALEKSKSALLVIDAQVGILENAFERDKKISNMATAVAKARSASVPVIWVQHNDDEYVKGSAAWQIVPELMPADGEILVDKNYRSAFISTNLLEVLKGLETSTIYLCGAESNNCVRHTAHSAMERDFDIVLVSDAHTCTGFEWDGFRVDAERVIDEQNTNFLGYSLPNSQANLKTSAELFQ